MSVILRKYFDKIKYGEAFSAWQLSIIKHWFGIFIYLFTYFFLFLQLQNERIVSLHTCQLYTCAWCESGSLFWWGVLPFNQRKKLWEKFRSKSRKQRSEITEGVQASACLLMWKFVYPILWRYRFNYIYFISIKFSF